MRATGARLALSLLMLLVAAPLVAAKQVPLTVLFTSDMHAHVLPYDDVRDKPAQGSVAQVATLVARVRREVKNTVVLDGGDAIEGTALGYYGIAAPGASGDDPTIAAMNIVGYDAAVLGNHEFNFGLDVLRRSLSQSRFPWLAANLEGAAAAKLPVQDELVVVRGGLRIGILGLTNPNIPHWDPPSHWAGLTFTDPVEVARARLAALHARADLVIVVVHSGFERDLTTGAPNDTDYENYAWRLAQLPGIDLLLTGHTHENIPPQRLGQTIIAQPGRWADHVTRIDLVMEKERAGWKVASWKGENLKTAGEQPDARVVAGAAKLHEKTLAELGRTLGTLTVPLDADGVPTADDPSIDLIHAVQLEASGAQLSLAAPLSGSHLHVPAGPLTPRLAMALYPYPNSLVVVRLSGAELRDVLEHAVRGWTGATCGQDGVETLRRERRLPAYNYDTLEGAEYLIAPTAPLGQRVRSLFYNGKPVKPDDTFTVVINSYRAAGGGNYPHLETAPVVKEINHPMFELLVDYFTRHPTLTPSADDNWGFVMPLREVVADPRAAASPQ